MNQILAALIFFTRLPFWKIKEVPQECFKHVVNYWSFSGWLTGGMMALIFWGASTILPHGVAVLLAHIALFFFVFYPFEITFHFVPYFQDQGIGIIPVLSDIPAFPG